MAQHTQEVAVSSGSRITVVAVAVIAAVVVPKAVVVVTVDFTFLKDVVEVVVAIVVVSVAVVQHLIFRHFNVTKKIYFYSFDNQVS